MAVANISSRSSPYDGTSPLPHHRFDHMIEEQKNIVMNAQEGLNQSLLILEKATTKEEMESAKLQVESLLPRCEELLTKLMVVINVRSELDCLQKDLLRAKKCRLNATKLYARQQWLESRLEKLIFSKRRARPGGRLQRGPGPGPTQETRFSNSMPYGTRRVFQSQYDRVERGQLAFQTHKRSATISTWSDAGGVSFSQRGDEEGSSITSCVESTAGRRTVATQERESNSEWNSESEANWTVVDTYSNRRYTPNEQIMEEQEKEQQGEGNESLEDQEQQQEELRNNQLHTSGIDSGDSACSFENVRPTSVFGTASWNVLLLAKYGNYLDKCEGTTAVEGPPETVLKNPLIDSDLVKLWTELLRLQELVQSASKIMKRRGQTLPPLPTRKQLLISSYSRGQQMSDIQDRPHTRALSENDKFKLETVLPEINYEKLKKMHLSKSVQTSKKTYPKSPFTWFHPHDKTRPSGMSIQRVEMDSELDYTINPSSLKQSRRLASRSKSARQKALTSLVNEHLEDYKRNNIEELIVTLNSSESVEKRRDAAQALRYLTDFEREMEIISTLRNSVINDQSPHVKHEAIKSLIKYGAWDSHLYSLVSELLVKGNAALQDDILTVMMNKSCLGFQSNTNNKEDSRERLLLSLEQLVTGDSVNDLAFKAAVVLTEVGMTSEENNRVLRETLAGGSPQQKMKALNCLVSYYYMDSTDNGLIMSGTRLAEQSIDWKIRLNSVECLLRMYQLKQQAKTDDTEMRKEVIQFAKQRLVSEPVHVVRVAIGNLLTHLGKKYELEEELIRELERTDEMERAEAAIALSAFTSGNSKVQNALMDVVEFDPSVFVRLLVLNLLGKSKSLSSITMSRLQRMCVGTGVLAKHCRSILASIFK